MAPSQIFQPSPFGRYRRIVVGTLIAIVVLAGLMLVREVIAGVDELTAESQRQLADRARELDQLTKTAEDHIGMLEAALVHELGDETGADLHHLGELEATEGGVRFQRRSDLRRAQVGNVTGLGSPSSLDDVRRREVSAALGLDPLLARTLQQVPDAVWVYYISALDFMTLHPWTEEDVAFSRAVYRTVGYQVTSPGTRREVVWSPVYVDYAGRGLMVTCAKGVYSQNRYRGQVGLDVQLKGLNALMVRLGPTLGTTFLVNEGGELLAHPTLVGPAMREVRHARDALPVGLELSELTGATDARYFRGAFVAQRRLDHLPWRLVVVIPHLTLHWHALPPIALLFIGLVLALLAVTVAAQLTVEQAFIRPARALLEHIQRQGEGSEGASIPRNWAPWFETISRLFAERVAAAQTLERRVVERTRDLDERNAELQRAFAELRAAQARLVQQEKLASLGALAATLAHEVNSPVGVIKSSADTGLRVIARLRALVEAERERGFEVDARLMKSLDALTTLAASASDAGHQVADLVHALHAFEDSAGEGQALVQVDREVSLAFDAVTPLLPPDIVLERQLGATRAVLARPGAVRRVAGVLLSNAINAVAERGRITVTTLDHRDSVVLEVRDDGCGIDPARQATLFELEFQRDQRRVRVGLGLKIAAAIVGRLGGSIDVTSAPGAGATFTVRLPIAPP